MLSFAEELTVSKFCIRDVIYVFQSMRIDEAVRLMRDHCVGSLVVLAGEEDKRTVSGIVTDRDIALGVLADAQASGAIRVADVMSHEPITCRSEDSVHTALNLMREHGIRRLPVVDDDLELAGIICLDDLLDVLAQELQGLIQVIQREKQRVIRVHA